MQSLNKLPKLNGARVLVRVDYNVPLKGTKIVDTRRIDASFETIDTILKKKGTPVLIAHLGDGTESLRPIATYLSKTYKTVFVTNDLIDKRTIDILDEVPSGTVVLLENIRRYSDEEKNTASFAKLLARLGQYYVNDAFSVSHRKHASVVGIAKHLPSYGGIQLQREIKALSSALKPTHPFVFILGGAKFGTKIPLLKQFETKADKLIVAGAILNNFYTVAGFEVGKSVVESGYDTPIKKLIRNEKLLLPIDVVVTRGTRRLTLTPDEVQKSDVIVDIGPQSCAHIAAVIQKAKFVVWNGPTGWYEKGFVGGTKAVAEAILASKTKAIIGGGDTGAVIESMITDSDAKRIFISTGGGAALDYLATGALPGIAVLK
jgi:phosphoglycerate kinase